MTAAQAAAGMVDPAVTQSFLNEGWIGGLVLVCFSVIGGLLIYIRSLHNDSKELLKNVAGLTATVTEVVRRATEIMEKRSDATKDLADAVNRSAEATRAQMALAEVHHDRLHDRIKASDQTMEAISQAVRGMNENVTRLASRMYGPRLVAGGGNDGL